MAEKYGVAPEALLACLRDTAFKVKRDEQPFSDTEIAAALIIAEQHDLNPFAKEIYVTRSHGKLLVIVPIDGWAKLVNREGSYDGCEFETILDEKGKPYSIACRMFRKDRSHPTEITEYLSECHRDTEPWNGWPSRMLRHKAFIQAARYAFSLSGVMDDDEAERMIDAEVEAPRQRPALPAPRELQDQPWDSRQAREPVGAGLEQELDRTARASSVPSAETKPSPAPGVEATPDQINREAVAEPGRNDPPLGAGEDHYKLWQQLSSMRKDLGIEGIRKVKAALGVDSLSPSLTVDQLRVAVEVAQDLAR